MNIESFDYLNYPIIGTKTALARIQESAKGTGSPAFFAGVALECQLSKQGWARLSLPACWRGTADPSAGLPPLRSIDRQTVHAIARWSNNNRARGPEGGHSCGREYQWKYPSNQSHFKIQYLVHHQSVLRAKLINSGLLSTHLVHTTIHDQKRAQSSQRGAREITHHHRALLAHAYILQGYQYDRLSVQ